ncbi:37S ribosomal protein S24, mitochondrial [Cladophialophora chaetospira]|uniref:37S ribosomal protein S24, mitochondrial n=1 Tax=Cladophialophora chaetospira TaxID=386627 RepID=A0AA38WYJ8_9EURO|nr:37S ribosomal protein S24, mitochondrial [Cladophialophora chaetospira]
MATPARYLSRTLFQVTRRIPVKRKCITPGFTRPRVAPSSMQHRELSTTLRRGADNTRHTSAFNPAQDEGDDEEVPIDFGKEPEGGYKTPNHPIALEDLDADELADYDMLTPKDKAAYLKLQNHYAAEFEEAGIDTWSDHDGELEDPFMDKVVADLERKLDRETEPLDFPDVPLQAKEKGFWALDEEDDEFTQVEDGEEEWDESAISSVAQSELDLHREVREYTRVIAWDMPLLQKFAKPFTPPTDATPLRFRYTTYMGEYHPAARKVVLQFSPKDLPDLTPAQLLKFLKLVGPRYNPDTEVVKMACEQFEAPAQNKRYLGDQVKKLLDEAKNGEDSLEDIPLDLRHHKAKRRVEFPESWKLKPSRVKELLLARQEQALLDEGQTIQQKSVLDGKELVHEYVRQINRPVPLNSQRAL